MSLLGVADDVSRRWSVNGGSVTVRMYLRWLFFFFNDTATTEIYTLSLHDALPISGSGSSPPTASSRWTGSSPTCRRSDRKSTRLNSSHGYISYALFCLKKKNTRQLDPPPHSHIATHATLTNYHITPLIGRHHAQLC